MGVAQGRQKGDAFRGRCPQFLGCLAKDVDSTGGFLRLYLGSRVLEGYDGDLLLVMVSSAKGM